VQRLVIANTVEQRILELQTKKEALSDGAMGEGNGGRLGRLNVADLMRLFNYDNGV
jgi:SNF2 family DNA or RNA helicase